jgi:hypothetical protein
MIVAAIPTTRVMLAGMVRRPTVDDVRAASPVIITTVAEI